MGKAIKKALLILLCLPMIGFGQEPCKKRKCKRCAISVIHPTNSTIGVSIWSEYTEISDILEKKITHHNIYLIFYPFYKRWNKTKVNKVEFYFKNKITNQTTQTQTSEDMQIDYYANHYIFKEFVSFTDTAGLIPKDYIHQQGLKIIDFIELYYRAYCYDSKYYSEWFVQEEIPYYDVTDLGDIEAILTRYSGAEAKIDIHNPDFDIKPFFYDSTANRKNHVTYTTIPKIDYTAIATIESKYKQEGILSILKDIGLDVIIVTETRKTPIHTTPIRILPSYTGATTHIQTSPGIVKSYPGKTFGGGVIGGETYGGHEYDWYIYTLIKKKELNQKINKDDKYDILLKLLELKDKGVLNEEEFQKEKQKILENE